MKLTVGVQDASLDLCMTSSIQFLILTHQLTLLIYLICQLLSAFPGIMIWMLTPMPPLQMLIPSALLQMSTSSPLNPDTNSFVAAIDSDSITISSDADTSDSSMP